jgi:hypothetical protein
MTKKIWVRDPDSGGVKVPDDVKVRTTERIERYAEKHFQGKYSRIDVRFRGQFCYVDAYTEPGQHVFVPAGMSREEVVERLRNTPTKLCRLRYFGQDDSWSMGFFKYSDEKYELCVFPSGDFWGPPEEAFEIAAGVYLEE